MLKINNLIVSYGNIKALQGVSLEVKEGEIVTLIGANGAGKTTLLKTISGLIAPVSGTIYYSKNEKNSSLNHMAPHEIVRLGVSQVPEGRMVFANLSVAENLDLGAFLRRDAREVRESLDKAFQLFPRLKERVTQNAGTLSGGEQQMLAIARALMAKPKLLLMDEPSLGLAPILVKEIFETIRKINQEGLSILLVEQNAHLALQLAHRAYVLETGKIVLEGPARELAMNEEVKKAYLGA
ncbi:MAG: ABC transporter ATP-binding protein [Chlamydiae bacterium]|nr:ABC transporter ATP-binding protein [Chlamydiota bacterium]MBI3267365.1 ABC transporter ATP-binding protein [Chlamydiota bacterium]